MSTAFPILAKSAWLTRAAGCLVGAYFLTSAALKLFTGGAVTVGGGTGHAPAVQFVAIQIEIVLGAWLVLGRWRVAAWMSACLLLAVLTGVSLIGAFRGQSDCGCFGQLKVHPGITAAINLVTLGLLMVFRLAVKWAENRGTVAGVVALAVVAGGLVWIANGPVGEKLLVKWQGRTVALRSRVIDAGEETVGTVKRLPVTVTNSSSRDVRLIGGSVSCSCTTTQSLPVTVPADGEVQVEIELKFRGTPGDFDHRFDFFTDE